jgi:hypothetical protein
MTGDEARAIRRHLHLSARQVADFLGLNESSIYRWEWRHDDVVPPYYAIALRYMLEWPRRHRDYPHHRDYPAPPPSATTSCQHNPGEILSAT